MDVQWFCTISGQTAGPFSTQQLRELVGQGRLRAEDQVRRGVDGSWILAGHVKGLFPATRPANPVSDLPVAQPLEPTGLRAAAPAQQTPAASSTASSASPSDPFAIQTDQKTVKKTTGQAPIPGRRKKDKLRNYLVGGSIGVFVVCLVTIAIMVDPSMNQPAEDPVPRETTPRSANENIDVSLDGPPARPSEIVAEKPVVKPEEPKEPEGPGQPQEAIERISDEPSIQVENVRVEVLSAEIGSVRIIEPSGSAREIPGDFLTLTIGLKTDDVNDELQYSSWGTSANTDVSLRDSQGKSYRRQRPSKSRIEGEVGPEPVSLSQTVRDVLVFRAPKDPIDDLHLKLPCEAFGTSGFLQLTIPAGMIQVARQEETGVLAEMGLGSTGESVGDTPPPRRDIYDENYDPDGDVSKIMEDIDELGGGEQDAAERAFEGIGEN